MRCIYFTGEVCEAGLVQHHARFHYKPNSKEKEDYCNGTNFKECPRFKAYIEHLKATSKR